MSRARDERCAQHTGNIIYLYVRACTRSIREPVNFFLAFLLFLFTLSVSLPLPVSPLIRVFAKEAKREEDERNGQRLLTFCLYISIRVNRSSGKMRHNIEPWLAHKYSFVRLSVAPSLLILFFRFTPQFCCPPDVSTTTQVDFVTLIRMPYNIRIYEFVYIINERF